MKTKKYITQYCNLRFEWDTKGITIDKATENQLKEMLVLREKALLESGLTENELTLIYICRKRGIFKKVNQYAHGLKK